MTTLEKYLADNDRAVNVQSAEECIQELLNIPIGFVFRGVSDSSFKLTSSVFREIGQDNEQQGFRYARTHSDIRENLFFSEFKKVAHIHVSSEGLPKSKFDWLALMQHNGVPTRLIDVTKSSMIALYFAVRDWKKTSDSVVWAFSPEPIHVAGLYGLKGSDFPYEINENRNDPRNLPDFLDDTVFEEVFFNHFFTNKYDFLMIATPSWANSRLAAQQGAFLVTSNILDEADNTLLRLVQDTSIMDARIGKIGGAELAAKYGYDRPLRKIIIPARLKRRICQELYKMNIHAGTLFPGLEGAALGVAEIGKL